jgi:hypothetical protein
MARWTYWANDARADRSTTDALAVTHGLLCRPFFNVAGWRIPRVQLLAPGDELLLMHNGVAVRWFRIGRARPRVQLPESEVFEFVKPASVPGRAFLANRFKPDGRHAPLLTAIRVIPLKKPLALPAPHRSRNAIEPFVPFVP